MISLLRASFVHVPFAVAFVLFASGVGEAAQLTASWVDNSSGQAAFEVIRRTQGEKEYSKIADVPPGFLSYVDSSIAEGITYCYRVKAYTELTESDYSDEACASVSMSRFLVTVSKTGNGTGLVYSIPAGLFCGLDCGGIYVAGTPIKLIATPVSGSKFLGWSGGCSGTGPCVVTGNTSVEVTAMFGKAWTPKAALTP